MQKISNRISEILGIFLGMVFIISGSLKSVSSAAFAEQLRGYGVYFPEYMSPFIIVAEVLLGIVLILGVWQKIAAAITAFLLILFTLVYTYGLYFYDISNCGCFGSVDVFDGSPVWLYLRNTLLIGISIYIYFHPIVNSSTKNELLALGALVVGGSIVAYLSGLSSHKLHSEVESGTRKSIAVKDSPLKDLLVTHADSTYLVFAFSYTCPHCLNSVANLNQYEELKVVDKVIGIARGQMENEDFNRWFSPAFRIIEMPQGNKPIAKELPTSFYIKNDSIIEIFQGEIPCAYLFDNYLRNNK